MAAILKARVIKKEKFGEDTILLSCEMVEPAELGFKGGQYIIVNSQRLLANGKLGKRAYSIPSCDYEQKVFDLIIKKISDGIGSDFMHELKVDDIFEFSGPWGKYQLQAGDPNQKLLCISTDTGITAALGLVRGKTAYAINESKLVWFLSSENYFVPIERIESWIPPGLTFQVISSVPSIDNPARVPFIEKKLSEILENKSFSKICLSGDGAVLRELKKYFLGQGFKEDQFLMESFFHHEKLKTSTNTTNS